MEKQVFPTLSYTCLAPALELAISPPFSGNWYLGGMICVWDVIIMIGMSLPPISSQWTVLGGFMCIYAHVYILNLHIRTHTPSPLWHSSHPTWAPTPNTGFLSYPTEKGSFLNPSVTEALALGQNRGNEMVIKKTCKDLKIWNKNYS